MSARTLGPGAMVLDAASFVGLSDMSGFSAAGVDGVSLYVGGKFGVTRATVQAAWDANLVVQLNYERAEAAYLDGYNGGRAAADNALSQSAALGWNNDSPIVFSATDTTVMNTALADGWYQGMVDRMHASGARGGAYGPAAYLRHLAAQPWWPDDFVLWHWAGDGAQPESWTWAQQLYPGVTIAGVLVDKNRILKEYPFWSGLGHIDPPEVPVPAHVCYAQASDGSYIEIVNRMDGTQGWRHVGEIPGGAGAFYAVHPGAQGVNPCGPNEMGAMGHYDNVQDQAWVAAHAGGGSGPTPDQVANEVLNLMATRLGNG